MLFLAKRLIFIIIAGYSVPEVDTPDPVYVRMLQQALGGVEGEIRVCIRYMFQRGAIARPAPSMRFVAQLGDRGTRPDRNACNSRCAHLDQEPTDAQEEGATDPVVGAVMGGESPRHVLEGMIHKNLL